MMKCADCEADISQMSRSAVRCRDCSILRERKKAGVKRTSAGCKSLSCLSCGDDLPSHADGRRKHCDACYWRRMKLHNAVRNLTKTAIRKGLINPVDGQQCADCGADAKCYDHRDYNRPLDVAPVCMMCNWKRGAGIPLSLDIEVLRKEIAAA